ncbi:MAG: hypothetical protein KAV00_01105 [Phycisphaerae bacterium]|nr:hypothetical protein [Phycisphaerae bacterium]
MTQSAWRDRLCFLPLGLLALLYISTYGHSFVLWHDASTDDSVVASYGKIIITERVVPASKAPQSTVADAKLIAKDQYAVFPQPIPFRKSGGRRIVPLFPFVAASMLLPLLVVRLYERRRWWRHIAPAVPFLSLGLALNGRWIRELGEQGWGNALANSGTIIEAVGALTFLPAFVTWAFCLPRNIKHYRVSRRMGDSRCLKCGYSLTGNTSGVCPECGEAIEAV